MDRVPITPIPRKDTAFKRMTMDVIGPIEPTSAAGHKYCLRIVDSCARWPAVYLLKFLTAKSVCEELKKLFMDVGVPSVITSDQGTNFTIKLDEGILEDVRSNAKIQHTRTSRIIRNRGKMESNIQKDDSSRHYRQSKAVA